MTAPAPLAPPPPRSITPRAVLLGLAGVVFICGLTPYNDYALNNTFLVGNNLPLGVVMLLFIAALINAPLSRFAPRFAFTAGELTVAFSMTLISCALPSSGLMRYLPASLISPLYHARGYHEYLALLQSLNVPEWLYPSFAGASPAEWVNDPLVRGYMERAAEGDPSPYLGWLRPALTWGVFVAALYTALICQMTIVRRQWHENERLPFPLAELYLPLIEPPPPGRLLNGLFRRRGFWIAFAAVFLLHGWNALNRYHPEHFERIPVYYNLHDLFTAEPWRYVDAKVKDAAVFFTVVGVTYFLSSSVAFSLWFFYIAHQFYRMYLGLRTGDPAVYGQQDQHFGGILAFTLSVLWIGRHHWRLVLAQAFRGRRPGEPAGRYLPYPLAFWGFVASAAVMTLWLVLAGASLVAAAVSVLLLLLLFFVIARIIAEAGLVHGQLQVPIQKPWTLLTIYSHPHPVSTESFYLSSLLQCVHYDFREVVPVYASHGLKVADQTVFASRNMESDDAGARRTGRRLIALLALALLVGYAVSFTSTLWTEYRYAWTKDIPPKVPINDWGALNNPESQVLGATRQFEKGTYNLRHSPAAHITFGFVFTGLLSVARLRYSWWPLHPIGYLMIPTFPGAHLWFSIFCGWLAKVLLVRFGGSRLYLNAKPFFLGLIVGESLAAAFWLMMGILLSALNLPYRPMHIMPG